MGLQRQQNLCPKFALTSMTIYLNASLFQSINIIPVKYVWKNLNKMITSFSILVNAMALVELYITTALQNGFELKSKKKLLEALSTITLLNFNVKFAKVNFLASLR